MVINLKQWNWNFKELSRDRHVPHWIELEMEIQACVRSKVFVV